MRLIIILSFTLIFATCTSKKKSYCDLVQKPVFAEEALKTPALNSNPE